jgi:hypothetical protein
MADRPENVETRRPATFLWRGSKKIIQFLQAYAFGSPGFAVKGSPNYHRNSRRAMYFSFGE